MAVSRFKWVFYTVISTILLIAFFCLFSNSLGANSSSPNQINQTTNTHRQNEYLLTFTQQAKNSVDNEIEEQRQAFYDECEKEDIHYTVLKDFLPFVNVLHVKMTVEDATKMKKINGVIVETNGPVHIFRGENNQGIL